MEQAISPLSPDIDPQVVELITAYRAKMKVIMAIVEVDRKAHLEKILEDFKQATHGISHKQLTAAARHLDGRQSEEAKRELEEQALSSSEPCCLFIEGARLVPKPGREAPAGFIWKVVPGRWNRANVHFLVAFGEDGLECYREEEAIDLYERPTERIKPEFLKNLYPDFR